MSPLRRQGLIFSLFQLRRAIVFTVVLAVFFFILSILKAGEFVIAKPQKYPLRPFSEDERQHLLRLSRSKAAPAAEVARAKALLLVAEGKSFSQAAKLSGQYTGDTVASWVKRFNQEGIEAIRPRHGGGAAQRYSPQEQQRIHEVAQRAPDPSVDGVRVWSLSSLRRSLARHGVSVPSNATLWRILRTANASDIQWLDIRSPQKVRDSGSYSIRQINETKAEDTRNSPEKKLFFGPK